MIALLTDFGIQDPYASVMKGVIWSIHPEAQIVDLTHGIHPHHIIQAAFVLKATHAFFPEGTIYVAVVDPGVGTDRAVLIVQAGPYRFLAPDNGLLHYIFEDYPEARVFRANNPAYWLPNPSHTFHGRDIFAPLAAHLDAGVPIEALAEPATPVGKIRIPMPERREGRLVGHILYFDRFGNAVTDLPAAWFAQGTVRSVSAGRMRVRSLVRTYADLAPGEALAYIGSTGTLELAINQGSAEKRYGLKEGEAVIVRWTPNGDNA